MEQNLIQTVYLWLAPSSFILLFALALYARRRARYRHNPIPHHMGQTTLGRLVQPLPGDIDMIARIGTGARPRESAGIQVLRTTIGVRAISLGLSTLMIVLFGSNIFAAQGLTAADPMLFWALTALLAIGATDILTYELRFDRDGMVLTRFMYWRRSFEWSDLIGIDDDQNYQYVLAFSKGGRVKVLKHLVGMPAFLTLVAGVLDRNEARNARTARG